MRPPLIDINGENALRLERGWPLVLAIDVGDCDHCPGVGWKRIDGAFTCLACGCLRDARGRYSYCRVRRAA